MLSWDDYNVEENAASQPPIQPMMRSQTEPAEETTPLAAAVELEQE